ncbi:hypothetical protein TNCV_1289901 [Trichonephila clavipes]|nr:hypothetical protein TNCV_1289901 [Trichonephila clavipes]
MPTFKITHQIGTSNFPRVGGTELITMGFVSYFFSERHSKPNRSLIARTILKPTRDVKQLHQLAGEKTSLSIVQKFKQKKTLSSEGRGYAVVHPSASHKYQRTIIKAFNDWLEYKIKLEQ